MASWTVPTDRSTGDTITSAIWNENLGATANSALLKTSVNNSGALEFVDATELTIASGVITVTANYHKVDTEGDAASDDLDTITAGTNVAAGFILHLRVESAARTVVIKAGTGGSDNLDVGSDVTLDESYKTYSLVYDGTNWRPFTFAESPTFASLSPLTTRGDMLYGSSGTVTGTRLALGSAGQYVRSDGTDLAWAEGAKVIQVVTENLTTDNAYNGLAQNEVIDLSITPSNTANKILVYFSMCFKVDGDSNSTYPEAFVSLWRGDKSGTLLQAQTVSGGSDAHNTIYVITSGSIIYLDSPSTTSAQEYTITTANRQHTSSTYRGRIYMYGDGTPGGQPSGTDLPFVYKNACALTLAELDYS